MSSQLALIARCAHLPRRPVRPRSFGLALKGADRRVAARLQGRVGPPLAQPFFDLVKLGFKRTMVPLTGQSRLVFLYAPLVGVMVDADRRGADPGSPASARRTPRLGNLLVLVYLLMPSRAWC